MIYPAIGLLWLLHFLPFRLLQALGAGLGELLFLLIKPRRRVTLINLARAYPELDAGAQRRLARAHFREMAAALLTQTVLWWGSERRVRRLLHEVDAQHLEAHAGRPIILLAPHFVGLEWGAQAIGLRRLPGATLYRRQSSEVLTRLLVRARTRFMPFRLYSRQDGIKPIIRALRDKLILYYLPDQDFGPKESIFAPFFGIQTATVPALSRLSAMTGAVIIPCVTRRRGGSGFEVRFYPAWENFPGADAEEDTRRMNAFIEARVREMPAQYFWSHQRFKTRPPGEPPFY